MVAFYHRLLLSEAAGQWLTHLQPSTHCPIQLSPACFAQMAVDMDHFPSLGDLLLRRRQIKEEWEKFQLRNPHHTTVRSMAASGQDFNLSGYAMLSLCIPPTCCYRSRNARSNRLSGMFHRYRRISPEAAEVEVVNGVFALGPMTLDRGPSRLPGLAEQQSTHRKGWFAPSYLPQPRHPSGPGISRAGCAMDSRRPGSMLCSD